MLNVGRDCFGIACGFLGFTVIKDIVGAGSFPAHMWPPRIIPASVFKTELGQVIKTSDERNSVQPFHFECLNDSFGHCNGSVFSDRTETRFDMPTFQQISERASYKDPGLIGDDVLRRSVEFNRPFQGINNPSCVGPFQWSHANNLPRKMINDHQNMNRRQAPGQNCCRIDRPDMVGIPGWNGRRC